MARKFVDGKEVLDCKPDRNNPANVLVNFRVPAYKVDGVTKTNRWCSMPKDEYSKKRYFVSKGCKEAPI